MDDKKYPGFQIDNFIITFPNNSSFVQEDSDGGLSILVDIHQIDSDNNRTKVPEEMVTPELEDKIQEFINNMLMQAIEEEQKNVKD